MLIMNIHVTVPGVQICPMSRSWQMVRVSSGPGGIHENRALEPPGEAPVSVACGMWVLGPAWLYPGAHDLDQVADKCSLEQGQELLE